MINSCVYDKIGVESEKLNIILHDLAARLSDEQWGINQFKQIEELKQYLEDKPLIDLFLYDVAKDEDIDKLIEIRKYYGLSHLLLLADNTISPMKYIKPGINAQSLLLRPFNKEQAYDVIGSFIKEYLASVYDDSKDNKATLLVESREGKVNIPYSQIYYIEAMEKKIFVCTGIEEYGFYGTLDSLEESLPDEFVRCHRSFIVNSNRIKKVALSKNTIYLEDEYEVPLSRSYKSVLKGMGNG